MSGRGRFTIQNAEIMLDSRNRFLAWDLARVNRAARVPKFLDRVGFVDRRFLEEGLAVRQAAFVSARHVG